MRRFLLLLASVLAASSFANAQLGGLASRALNKVTNKIEDNVEKNVEKRVENTVERKVEERIMRDYYDTALGDDGSPIEILSWDDLDKFAVPTSEAPEVAFSDKVAKLITKFPSVPSAAAIVGSSAKDKDAYMASIDAALGEFDKYSQAVEDEYSAIAEKLTEERLRQSMGLSEEDMKKLQDENVSDAEKQAIMQKSSADYAQNYTEADIARMNRVVTYSGVAGERNIAALRRMRAFEKKANAELDAVDKEAQPLETKLIVAFTKSKQKELNTKIYAIRGPKSKELIERQQPELELQLQAARATFNESAAMSDAFYASYDRKMQEYVRYNYEREYIVQLASVLRRAYKYYVAPVE